MMSSNQSTAKMNWDLGSYFPEYGGPEMKSSKKLKADIAAVQKKAAALPSLGADNMAEWEDIVLEAEDIMSRYSHIDSYIGCLASADGLNEDYVREEGEMSAMHAELSKLKVELIRALKGVPEEVFDRFTEREKLSDAAYYIGRLRILSERSMNPDKEILASDLGVDGISAWGRLYDTVSSRLEFEMKYPDGTVKTLPISQRRSLMEKPERTSEKRHSGREPCMGRPLKTRQPRR
ncbi:MAG: hypothetical protein R3B51_09515 [Thermodesulfobacteriota bacterium]